MTKRTCFECGTQYDAWHATCPKCRVFTPTEEEIAVACEFIRKSWPESRWAKYKCEQVQMEVWKLILGKGRVAE